MHIPRPLQRSSGTLQAGDKILEIKTQAAGVIRSRDHRLSCRRKFVIAVLWVMIIGSLKPNVWAQEIYNFSYFDPTGESACGQLVAIPNNAGGYTVTNGFFDGLTGGILGTYNLYLNPNVPGTHATSPQGAFLYDNELFPDADPVLNTYGLLFTNNTIEINLWGGDPSGNMSSGTYSLYDHDATTSGYSISYTGTATFDLVAVPEPGVGTLILAALGLRFCVHRPGTWRGSKSKANCE